MRLPYIGSSGERFAKSITTAVGKCYFSAAVRVFVQTRTAFVSMRNHILPPHHINSVIYKYTCSCGSDYIGGTSNRLDLRIKQHLPAQILNTELKRGQLANTSGSSIAEHMINSRECVADFNVDRFSIRFSIKKCWRLFTFDPISLPSVNRETFCWDWMWSVSDHLFISTTTTPLLVFFPPPFSFLLLFSYIYIHIYKSVYALVCIWIWFGIKKDFKL